MHYKAINALEAGTDEVMLGPVNDPELLDAASLLAYKLTDIVEEYNLSAGDIPMILAVMNKGAAAMVQQALRILMVHMHLVNHEEV